MSVVGLDIDLQVNGSDGGPELRRISVAFERAGDELADFSKHVFPKLTPVFETEARRQFDSEGAGPSGPWAQLSPAYAKWKEQHYPGQPILRATNALYEALTDSSSPYAARSFNATDFQYGTSGVPYATYHQFGEGSRHRPPFDFSSDFERDVQDAALEAVREVVQTSGVGEFVEGP